MDNQMKFMYQNANGQSKSCSINRHIFNLILCSTIISLGYVLVQLSS